MLSHDFDRVGWLQRTGYLTRRILFLDLHHWIKLAEERDEVYRELAKALIDVVDAGSLICPISPSILMEVEKRPQDDKRYKCCLLMDRLSGRLSLRVDQAIFTEEYRAQILGQRIDRQIAYSFFLDAMTSRSRMTFPEGWSEASAQQAARMAFDRLISMSIPVSVNMRTDEQRERNIGFLRQGWTSWLSRRNNGGSKISGCPPQRSSERNSPRPSMR